MVNAEQVARSRAIQRRTGRTFHLATRLFPERVRHDTYVLYAFFRLADDVVDDVDDPDAATQRARLERYRAAALGERETEDPVLSAFAAVRERCDVAREDVAAFVDAMAADVDTDRYERYADLEAYMDGSASAVGRMMTAIMDLPPEMEAEALPHATALGRAFQLTNFLRDVREDAVELDRVYLPVETLRAYGASERQVRDLEYSRGFAAAMAHEMRRTEALYRRGVAGIRYLPDDCQFAVTLAAVLYADHHRIVRDRDYDVLSGIPTLSTGRKLSLLARTALAWVRHRDPEAVFYRVGCVPEDPETGAAPTIETPSATVGVGANRTGTPDPDASGGETPGTGGRETGTSATESGSDAGVFDRLETR